MRIGGVALVLGLLLSACAPANKPGASEEARPSQFVVRDLPLPQTNRLATDEPPFYETETLQWGGRSTRELNESVFCPQSESTLQTTWLQSDGGFPQVVEQVCQYSTADAAAENFDRLLNSIPTLTDAPNFVDGISSTERTTRPAGYEPRAEEAAFYCGQGSVTTRCASGMFLGLYGRYIVSVSLQSTGEIRVSALKPMITAVDELAADLALAAGETSADERHGIHSLASR